VQINTFYILGRGDPAEPSGAVKPAVSSVSSDEEALTTVENEAVKEVKPTSEAVPATGKDANTQATADTKKSTRRHQQRRAKRIAAFNKIPAEDRARTMSKRLGLTEEQEKELAEILARYSEQYAELEKTQMSEAERVEAQGQILSRQIQDLAPIMRESPAMRTAMQRFMEAGEARGGKLVNAKNQ
jgi:hypothetical protein